MFILQKLGAGLSIYLKQLTSFVAYGNRIGFRNWIKTAATMGPKEFIKTWQEISEESVYVKYRYWETINKSIEAYGEKLLVEFLDTADAKLAISRIDKVILPMSLKASSESDIPVVEDSSLSRSSKLPLYVREKLNAAWERLSIMHENQMESLLMKLHFMQLEVYRVLEKLHLQNL